MKQNIQIENLKCGGCAATIVKGLTSLEGVDDVTVNVTENTVSYTATKENDLLVKEKLSKLGYPTVGDKNTVLHKAKSFVSCAVGRLEK